MNILFIFLLATKGFAASSLPLKPGALISVRMNSTVGVLLDLIPASIDSRVIKDYLGKPESFWKARAAMQVETTLYRLVFRNSFYKDKGRLPLPPKDLWNLKVSRPYLFEVDSHRVVAVNYTFSSTLLAASDSVSQAESQLAEPGGQWAENFILPVDPELLLERTGFSCLNEMDFPPNSVDTENAKTFFDQTCLAGNTSCHYTQPAPKDSCNKALEKNVGRIETEMHFERLIWDARLADNVRTPIALNQNPSQNYGADLTVLNSGLELHRVIYRYIPKDSCAIQEGCVGGPGWRRLLQFDASVANRGRDPIQLGDVSADSDLVKQNMFEYSACHKHYHFSHYGKFSLGTSDQNLVSKRAFCLESTSRYSNNETTPLTHPYSCHFQGIAAGWGDDYIAGLECQWIDVTNVKTPTTVKVGFQVNPDQFLCEGKPILDSAGNFTFVPTNFKSETGDVQNRIACLFSNKVSTNNFGSSKVFLPAEGSFVTAACQRGEDSLLRNCGFSPLGALDHCTPEATVKLFCKLGAEGNPTVVRVCEASSALRTGTACTALDSLSNSVVESSGTLVKFKCPALRDANEPGGTYALYTAAAHEGDKISKVFCSSLKNDIQ